MSGMIKIFSTGILTILFYSSSLAVEKDYYNLYNQIKVVSVNDGLPQQGVTSIVQDKYGLLWVATYDGLGQYNGYDFKTYHHSRDDKNSLTSNRITSTLIDSYGNMWIGTDGFPSLNVYNYDSDNFKIIKDAHGSDVRTICEDSKRRLWIGTSQGLYIGQSATFDSIQYTFMPIKVDLKWRVSIKKIVRSKNNLMWIATSSSVIVADEGLKNIHCFENIAKNINDIYCDSKNNIFICSNSGIFVNKQTGAGFKKIDIALKNSDLISAKVWSITEMAEGEYLVGTEGIGLHTIYTNDFENWRVADHAVNDHSYFEFNLIKLFYTDKAGRLWIGSGNNGLAMIDLQSKKINTLKLSDKNAHYFISSLFRDSRNRLWIGTKLAGLYIQESDECKKMDINDNQFFNTIIEDRQGNIWISTNKNVYVYNNNTIKNLRDISGIPHDIYNYLDFSNCIVEDNFGNIWIGSQGALIKISNIFRQDVCCEYINEPYSTDIFCMYVDKKSNRLWCGSQQKGVFVLNQNNHGAVVSWASLMSKKSNGAAIKSDHIWNITKKSENEVWIATDAGLNSITINNTDTIVHNIDYSPKLKSSKIMSIIEDKNKNLWLNTSQGLLCYNPITSYYREYYYSDGLCSNTLTEAGFKDTKGNLYVGTISGVNYFNPEDIKDDLCISTPLITNVKINNVSIMPVDSGQKGILKRCILDTDRIELAYNQNNIIIEFLNPDLKNPQRNQYAYMLEGLDKSWIHSNGSNRQAAYNNLESGRYKFRLKIANADGVWNETEKVFLIHVKSAPWVTWWAYITYMLLISTIVFTIVRYYYLNHKFKQEARISQLQVEHEKAVNEIKLKFHTNISHEIRTALTLISAPLDELILQDELNSDKNQRLEFIKRNVDKLNNLVFQFLDLRKIDKEAMPLRIENTDIIYLLRSIYSGFNYLAAQKNITYGFICDESRIYGWVDQDKITKVVNNLLSNAFKFTPNSGEVTMEISCIEDNLEIKVTDTGVGIEQKDIDKIFDRFYQSESHENEGMGIGLALAKKLIELHRGDIRVESAYRSGATFIFTVAIEEDAYSGNEIIVSDDKIVCRTNHTFSEKPIILIVEDNTDMVKYLTLCLEDQYNIIANDNIESGIANALKYIPDLILLDIMLPGKSGLEMCEAIKSNIMTNHIPVIILTAKSEKEDIVLGYQKGAEDYVTKPFSSEVLKMKISNIIKYRHKRIENINADEEMSIRSDLDHEFMQHINSIIDRNIGRSEFCINHICTELGTSRSQLYRKLKAITPKSISELIRDKRMAEAKKLMLCGNFNVSEVMYQVGINSNSYFTKTFRDYFGVVPSDYLKNMKP